MRNRRGRTLQSLDDSMASSVGRDQGLSELHSLPDPYPKDINASGEILARSMRPGDI